MKNKFISATLLATALLFSACGNSTDAESALDTQQMLDNGEFSAVISKLEGSASTDSDYLALASAYMGKAGFSLSSIVGNVIASGDSNESSTFSSYITQSKAKSNGKSLDDLDTAVGYYQKVVQNKCTDKNVTLNSAGKDVCLYVGLSKVSQTAVAVGYITEDINVLSDSSTGSDDKLTASTCAIEYAQDPTTVDAQCSVVVDGNVTFTQSNKTYEEITITVNGNEFQNLITNATPRSTAIANGICSKDNFATRIADKNATGYDNTLTYHACPLAETNATNDSTTEDILVTALNDGTDSIGVAVSEDVKNNIDTFKNDVLKANSRGNDTNKTITIDDITAYLSQQNK